jgi:hypothetical protein
MCSSKTVLGVLFVDYFKVINGVFGIFKVNKCRKPFVLARFLYILGRIEGFLTSMTPSTTTPWAGHSPRQ